MFVNVYFWYILYSSTHMKENGSITYKMIRRFFILNSISFRHDMAWQKESSVHHQLMLVRVNGIEMLQEEGQQIGAQGFIFKTETALEEAKEK